MLNAYEAHNLAFHSIKKEKVKAFNEFNLFSELDRIYYKVYAAALDGKTTIIVELPGQFLEDQIEEIVEVLNRPRYSAPFELQENCWTLQVSWW